MSLKGYSTPKLNFCHWSLTRMSFQTRKSFVRLRTQTKIFVAFWQLSDPPIDSNVINTINVEKCSKEIGKIIHVTSEVQP